MASYRDPPSRTQRATAIAAVAALHVALGLLVLHHSTDIDRAPDANPMRLIDIVLPPPPPPARPAPKPVAKAAARAGESGKRATPAAVVVPPPKLVVPATNPVATARIAATGSAPSAGMGSSGLGPGSGGSGDGRGAGGNGSGGGGGIGEDARLLSGGLNRRDYRYLRTFAAPSGRAVLAIMIGPDGRVAQCSVRQSSGVPALDAALCSILQPRMRWAPARDRSGRPLTVGLYYTATWSAD